MRRIRGVKVGEFDITIRYVPGEAAFALRMEKEFSRAHVNMGWDSFVEFRKQVNLAWHEYEKAQEPGPKPGEWEPAEKTKAKK